MADASPRDRYVLAVLSAPLIDRDAAKGALNLWPLHASHSSRSVAVVFATRRHASRASSHQSCKQG